MISHGGLGLFVVVVVAAARDSVGVVRRGRKRKKAQGTVPYVSFCSQNYYAKICKSYLTVHVKKTFMEKRYYSLSTDMVFSVSGMLKTAFYYTRTFSSLIGEFTTENN